MSNLANKTRQTLQLRKKRMELELPLETISRLSLIPTDRLKQLEEGITTPHPNETEVLNQLLMEHPLLFSEEPLGIKEPAAVYGNTETTNKEFVLYQIREVFAKESKLRQAWIFGSFAKKSSPLFNDIDIAITTDQGFSYFDLADLQFQLEQATGMKIDIGFADTIQLSVTANNPLPTLIYAR